MLNVPTLHTERVVERVSFLPSGGERWRREVQITVPHAQEGQDPLELTRFIVSLGLFRRLRFPDFAVHDADGRRLPLVTRDQHRHSVAMATLAKYLDDDQWERMPAATPDEWRTVYDEIGDLITDIACDREHSVERIESAAHDLFEKLGVANAEHVTEELGDDCHELAYYTHYLCWVPASWGDTVSLTATYTMSDTVRIAGRPRKPLPATVLETEPPTDKSGPWQRFRMKRYTSLGLCPVSYEFRAPSHDHAGSYYFSVEPPADAHMVLLDWGTDRWFATTTGEVDSPFATCHVHNGDPLEGLSDSELAEQPDAGETAAPQADGMPAANTASEHARPRKNDDWKISAFLKADPVDNAALVAIASFNIALAYLAQKGAFLPHVDGRQQWILLAPVVLVALIAQHRARYYSEVTRPLRGVMWLYAAATVAFGASVAFEGNLVPGMGDLSFSDNLVSGGMACLSLGLLLMLALSGGFFDRATAWEYRRRLARADHKSEADDDSEADEDSGEDDDSSGVSYLSVARWYADIAIATTVVLLVGAGLAMVKLNWGAEQRSKALQAQRTDD
ncbi:MAG: hypothetical protein WEB79_04230 [Thermoleophilaceae bacterium]